MEEDTIDQSGEKGHTNLSSRIARLQVKDEAAALRQAEQALACLESIDENVLLVRKGIVDGMRVPGRVYVDETLRKQLREEIFFYHLSNKTSFLPALYQIGNAAALPGIIGMSIGLPDIHTGYGFAIGHVAAFDMDDPQSVVSPGGVGFDINCGVRMLRTNLLLEEVRPVQEQLADHLFDLIPVGVGGRCKGGGIELCELREIMSRGMEWAVERDLAWPEDREFCEERGRITFPSQTQSTPPSSTHQRAEAKGRIQLGTLGSGNHYVEVQFVSQIDDPKAAQAMGITRVGQICAMIHCGSRGLGHDIADNAIKSMANSEIPLNDPMLACTRIASPAGQQYLNSMAGASNFAYVNRSAIASCIRQAFERVFKRTARDLDMHTVYDVSHNIAKVEVHEVEGLKRRLLVHRKGSTRAFPPGHPDLPKAYREIGQPVLVGGTMGTCSYVLTGTERGMRETFGSTCHGAGRAVSRHEMRRRLKPEEVMQDLREKNISIRVGSENAISEEAPSSYKDVTQVVKVCHEAGISKKAFRLEPICVIKG